MMMMTPLGPCDSTTADSQHVGAHYLSCALYARQHGADDEVVRLLAARAREYIGRAREEIMGRGRLPLGWIPWILQP